MIISVPAAAIATLGNGVAHIDRALSLAQDNQPDVADMRAAVKEGRREFSQAAEGVARLASKGVPGAALAQPLAEDAARLTKTAASLLRSPGGTDGGGINQLMHLLEKANDSAQESADILANPARAEQAAAAERTTSRSAGGAGSSGSTSDSVDSSSDRGPYYVDGEWIDGLGNPTRGGDSGWTGPDGQSFGWDGSPDRGSAGDTGPDGTDYDGV